MGTGDDDVILGGLTVQQAVPELHNRYRSCPRLCHLDHVLCVRISPGSFKVGSGADVCFCLADTINRIQIWEEPEQTV
jgi:hypothetical protein